mmetsp:Transcript_18708/g.24784  ORF Transcript_18708/g.24784 Transcript_18708/m.24784 type:complete len:215 (+) Transcript_18708:113-757(+)
MLNVYPSTPSYCPGSIERRDELLEAYKLLGEGRAFLLEPEESAKDSRGKEKPQVPMEQRIAIIDCGTFGEADFNATALQTAALGPVLAYVELPGGKSFDDANKWLQNIAIPFLNDKTQILGSSSVVLATPPSQLKNVTNAAVGSLEYVSIAVNTPPSIALPYVSLMGGMRGSYPAYKQDNGFLGNVHGFPNVLKTVTYGPALDYNPNYRGNMKV